MSAAQEAMLKATADHTQAVTDLIWALCWLRQFKDVHLLDGTTALALSHGFREKLELRRQERPIFHTLCSEIGL